MEDFCQLRNCDNEIGKYWVKVSLSGLECIFCGISHAILFLHNPSKHDTDDLVESVLDEQGREIC